MPSGEAGFIGSTHLPAAMARRTDVQRHHPLCEEARWRALAHTGRIQPMRLGQSSAYAIVLRQASTASFDGYPEGFEPLVERPTRRIDRCRIFERGFHLCQDTGQACGIVMQKLADLLLALALIARRAGRHQIAHAIGAVSGSRLHVIQFEWDIATVIVGTLMVPLAEDIFAYLVASQRALLVLHALDLGVVQGLCVEADEFLADRPHRAEREQTPHPGHHVADPAL